MIFTQTDVDSIKAALLALATGQRVVSATVNGKRIDYGQADVPQLTKLLSVMEASLSTSKASRTYLMETSKGL